MNYSSLVSQIQNFTEDDSTELSNEINNIILQTEEMIFQRLPSLPCFRQRSTGSLSIGTADYTVANARMIRQFAITDGSSNKIFLDHRVDSYLTDMHPNSSSTGQPTMYATKTATTSGITVTLAPTPSATLAFQVDFAAPETGISSSNTTTWISTNAENVLLMGSLYVTSTFLKAEEMLKVYKGKFDEAVALFQQEMGRNYTAEYEGGI